MSNEFDPRYEGLERKPEHECNEDCQVICDGCSMLMCSLDTVDYPRYIAGYPESFCAKCFEAAVIAEVRELLGKR